MDKLIVLEHSTKTVHIYNVYTQDNINEEWITNNTFHKIEDISWMSGFTDIVKHKGVFV